MMAAVLDNPPSLLYAAEALLPSAFGLLELRGWQRDAIGALLDGSKRVLVVAPTGGGKSLTYQLPALVLPGTTLVLSPLIALMEDQVRALEERGIAATYLASNLPVEERRAREQRFARGEYKIVYAAPERLAFDGFLQTLKRVRPSLVAIDEAHCITQWGHDFRPDYLRIGGLLEELAPERVLACTATATPDVRRDIVERLGFSARPHDEVLRGFARPNLRLEARWVDGKKESQREVEAALLQALGSPASPRGGAIVYAATRRNVEAVAEKLSAKKWRAEAYHAGLPPEERSRVADAFAAKRAHVIVATNAFGMGIDRDDVRLVAHAQPPSSIEAYYQVVGLAGRDGEDAHGLLLCSSADIGLRRRLVERSSDGTATPEAIARNWKLFRELLTYLDARTCRHDFVLRYFGDEREVLGGCGHCDICEAVEERPTEDATLTVQKALSGVARANKRAGIAAVAAMLTGKSDERTRRFGFTQLSTFGLFSSESLEWVMALLRSLIAAGWVDLTPTDHPVPFLTRAGWEAMRGARPIPLLLPARARARTKRERGAKSDDPLFELLRAFRAEIAKERHVPAYVIAHDQALLEMIAKKPKTLTELASVKGFGMARSEQYGPGFLRVLDAATSEPVPVAGLQATASSP